MHKVAICLMTCEIDHLEEWYLHHKSYSFKNFFVFLDSKIVSSLDSVGHNLVSEIKNIQIIDSEKDGKPLQTALYTAVCRKYDNFDYILFIDSDEYYESKTKNIQEDILILKDKYGDFDGFGLCWRSYGALPPFQNRVSIYEYKQWCPSVYVKSLVNPKSVNYFYSAHGAVLKPNSKAYISENGKIEDFCKIKTHSSENVWIKHLRMRSQSEWDLKFNRTGWYKNSVPIWYYDKNMKSDEIFDIFNLKCKQPGTSDLQPFLKDE